MTPNPASLYLESEAASIPRLQLVRMVYSGAIQSLENARTKLEHNDRAAFVKATNKAQNLIAELQRALDHEQGGAVARQLERLYEWMQRTLTPAYLQGNAEAIASVQRVLETLKSGWDGIRDEAALGEIVDPV